jgi:hypothetical protein
MNWDAVGAIGELVSAFAVLATLLYLSIQIRQNSKMMKANSKQSISDATQQMIYKMLDEPEVAHKMLNGGGDLDGIEFTKAYLLTRAMFRGYEAQIYQHEVGLLDEKEWHELKKVIEETSNFPGFHQLWPELANSVSPSLKAIVEEARR